MQDTELLASIIGLMPRVDFNYLLFKYNQEERSRLRELRDYYENKNHEALLKIIPRAYL